MKQFFTFRLNRFLALTFVLAAITIKLSAQSSHAVSVSNYKYTPAELTITAGDEVVWTNAGGTHNVDGKTSAFPTNPVSFGNNLSGSAWTYKFVFTTPGTYNYQCDPHTSLGMVGKIIVNPSSVTSSRTIADNSGKITLYPIPASAYVQLAVPAGYSAIQSLKVFSISGTLIDQKVLSGNNEGIRYDISSYKSGVYFMEINSGIRKEVLKFVRQ